MLEILQDQYFPTALNDIQESFADEKDKPMNDPLVEDSNRARKGKDLSHHCEEELPSYSKKTAKISRHEEDDKLLQELLWDLGPVVLPLNRDQGALPLQPPGSDVGSSQKQLFMEEDEMVTWLQYNNFCGNTMQQPQPSSRVSSCCQVADCTESTKEAVTRQGSSGMVTVDAGKVFDSGSVEASIVGCSTHMSNRKRKHRSGKDPECHPEDVEVEYGLKRKEVCHSASIRTRAAEVHNLSERRRRDRINEKMKALQELIPRCNKSDKASMLDDAIEYLKSLQLQVQMLSSMQYTIGQGQMMFTDAQRYLQTMGFMGMGMRMGIASGGIQCPVMPYGPILPYPPVVGPSPANLQPQPMSSFHLANIAVPNQVGAEASNQQDPALNSVNAMNPNVVQVSNIADPYHCYAPFHHRQVQSQGQALAKPGIGKETILSS